MRRGRELKARTSSLPGSPILFGWFQVGPDAIAANNPWIRSGSAPLGGREGLEPYEAFVSRKAYWAKRPTRASLVTVGLRCLLLEVRLSWKSFARLRPSKRPELVGLLAWPRGIAAPPLWRCRSPRARVGPSVRREGCFSPLSRRRTTSCARAAGPFSIVQRTPLRRTCATRSDRRCSGRVGRESYVE